MKISFDLSGPERHRRTRQLLLVALCFGTTSVALAAESTTSVSWTKMVVGLFGGLALFLFGMDMMASALKVAAGECMKNVLARLTTNPYMGAATGAAVTEVINMKRRIRKEMNRASLHQAERLISDEPRRLTAYTIEMDIIEKLNRIYYYARRMAKVAIPAQNLANNQ